MKNQIENGIVTICAWHDSEQEYFKRNPLHRGLGLTFTHGICDDCRAKQNIPKEKRSTDNTLKLLGVI